MKKERIILFVFMFILIGCSEDKVYNSVDTLIASFPYESPRVAIQENRQVLWSAGDQFKAFDVNGGSACYQLVGEGNVAQGQFRYTHGEAGTLVHAFFPSYDDKDVSMDGNIMTFKAKKVYKKEENSHNSPMLGTVQDNHVYFRHLFAMVKLDLTGVPEIYRRVEIEADKVICGKFSLDVSRDESLPHALNTPAKYRTIALDRKVDENTYYISLPPASYAFIKVYIIDAEGNKRLKIDMANKSLDAGVLYIANLGSSLPLLYPLMTPRANPQEAYVTPEQIIDDEWVAVGIQKRDYALQRDSFNLHNGRPSYRFELRGAEDNSLDGYGGSDKGRTELCYSYATEKDFMNHPEVSYADKQQLKTVYLYGKGHCNQGAKMHYTFSFRLPSNSDSNMHTIFAQWHGMPKRNLVYNADEEKEEMLTDKEFIALGDRMEFKKDKGYDKVTGQLNGWICEQGGYPPMAFGFTDGYFYIQANSDKKWLSDKDERCNINPSKAEIGQVNSTVNKSSTLAYKLAFADFPKDTWVTFDVEVEWSTYVYGKNEMSDAGSLLVHMKYVQDGILIEKEIVNMPDIAIGRNDDDGYYFKFGIYRTDGSEVPVSYNLAGYSESFR